MKVPDYANSQGCCRDERSTLTTPWGLAASDVLDGQSLPMAHSFTYVFPQLLSELLRRTLRMTVHQYEIAVPNPIL